VLPAQAAPHAQAAAVACNWCKANVWVNATVQVNTWVKMVNAWTVQLDVNNAAAALNATNAACTLS